MTQCSCKTEWTGLVECHCVNCHQSFSTDRNFEDHRTGDYDTGRRCYTADELATLTLQPSGRLRFKASPQKNGRVVWVSWSEDREWVADD
jgi:hypothetical protein